ncbi:MAG: hypothetical protein RBQ71_04215 [Acholeplasmataceae bacterium]|jgi:hypothetical protein|nr:hypothetical protein [Acholeplasmataceae bacterium]
MKIDIHSGYKTSMIRFVFGITIPFILASGIGIYFDYPFTKISIALISFNIPLIIFNVWAIKYYKPRTDGAQGLVYDYLIKNDDNTITLINDMDYKEIISNVTHIIYYETTIIDFILSIEGGQMPHNLKIRYNIDGNQMEKYIGSITKKELVRLKGEEMIYIQKRGKLSKF